MIDKVLPAFSVSFLIRSGVAGTFFVLALCAARWGHKPFDASGTKFLLEFGPFMAIVAGITVYTANRSLIFPWIEWALNANWVRGHRVKCPWISSNTVTLLLDNWTRDADSGSEDERIARHLTEWGDYLHFQYTAAGCIGAGALCGQWLTQTRLYANCPLIVLAIVLLVAAIASNWRWHSVEDALRARRAAAGQSS